MRDSNGRCPMRKRPVLLAALAVLVLVLVLVLIELCTPRISWIGSSPRPTPTLRPPPVPSSLAWDLAHDVPCAPPCWEGLTPGVSTLEEVSQAMRLLRQRDSVVQAGCQGTFCSVRDQDGTDVEVYFRDDETVETIWGWVPGSEYEEGALTVQQIIDRLGEPEGIIALSRFYGSEGLSASCDAAHRRDHTIFESGSWVQLLYLNSGAAFEFDVADEEGRRRLSLPVHQDLQL